MTINLRGFSPSLSNSLRPFCGWVGFTWQGWHMIGLEWKTISFAGSRFLTVCYCSWKLVFKSLNPIRWRHCQVKRHPKTNRTQTFLGIEWLLDSGSFSRSFSRSSFRFSSANSTGRVRAPRSTFDVSALKSILLSRSPRRCMSDHTLLKHNMTMVAAAAIREIKIHDMGRKSTRN